ncbi:MAG: hypothetical protein J6P21_04030 [Clostridia bacterium]|nr:hypothetical protein [Clostridia bacterium]
MKNSLLYAFIFSVFLAQKNKNLNLYALSDFSTSSAEQELIKSLSSGENSSSDLSDENKENSGEQNISYEIYSLLCEDSKLVFSSSDPKKLKEISQELKSVYEYLTKNYAISPESYDIADIAVISMLLKNGTIDSEKNDSAKKLSEAIETYQNYEKNKYDKNKYNSMQKASEEFGNKYKKSASCNPENVVLLKENKSLNNYPIVYNENILISLNDAVNFSGTNPEIEFMDNNATIVIKFNDKILEIEQGKNKAQLDDAQTVMENPVLNIDGVVYVPASILNLMSCKTVSYNNTVIIY